jgi:hypothetical protein
MVIHLIDGTYELFRHFHGLRRFTKGKDRPYGGVVGVLQTVVHIVAGGDTYWRSHGPREIRGRRQIQPAGRHHAPVFR